MTPETPKAPKKLTRAENISEKAERVRESLSSLRANNLIVETRKADVAHARRSEAAREAHLYATVDLLHALHSQRLHGEFLKRCNDLIDWVCARAVGLKPASFNKAARDHLLEPLTNIFGTYFPASLDATTLLNAASLEHSSVIHLRREISIFLDEQEHESLYALELLTGLRHSVHPATARPVLPTLRKDARELAVGFASDAQKRSRRPDLGKAFCSHCSSPSERYAITHTSVIDGVSALTERAVVPRHAIEQDFNPDVCVVHAGGSDNPRTKTASNNEGSIAAERNRLFFTFSVAGVVPHRSERILCKIACDRGQPSLLRKRIRHIDRDFLLARKALAAFLENLLGGLPTIAVSESLTQIDLSADGYLVGLDATGNEEFHHAVGSESELLHWRRLVGACFERLSSYLDIDCDRTDEAWLTIPGHTKAPQPIEPIPIASVIIVRPMRSTEDQVVVPRIGYALRDWIEINPTFRAGIKTVRPDCVGNTTPAEVIRISLLSPDWLRRVYQQPVVRSTAKPPAKTPVETPIS